MEILEEIKKLASLLNEGAITQEEFDLLKRNILSSLDDSKTINSKESQVADQPKEVVIGPFGAFSFKSKESEVHEQQEEIIEKVTNDSAFNHKPVSKKTNGLIVFIVSLIVFFIIISVLPKGNDGVENSSKSYKKDANKEKCSDMESYNYGYEVARDQQGLIADCNYLYDLAKTQRENINRYCFCKGVEDFQAKH